MTTRAPPSGDQCARAACSRLHRCGGKVLSLSSMRRSIRTSQRVRRALWYARDPRVSQPKHNGAWVGPPGGQRSKSSAASTEQKSKRAPLNRTIQPAEGTAPCVRKGRLQLRTSDVRFATCALLRARSCARSEWFYVGWMLVFSSALRTCSSAHSGFPCKVEAYR
jgi:hypothetical protein